MHVSSYLCLFAESPVLYSRLVATSVPEAAPSEVEACPWASAEEPAAFEAAAEESAIKEYPAADEAATQSLVPAEEPAADTEARAEVTLEYFA